MKADVEEETLKPQQPAASSEIIPPQGQIMNNGGRDTTNVNDIQKLQQQLQDIKEQVSITQYFVIFSKTFVG